MPGETTTPCASSIQLPNRLKKSCTSRCILGWLRVQNTDALVRLRFTRGPGVEGRPNFPFWKHYTAVWLHARIELLVCTRAQIARNVKCMPNFDRKPCPIWKPGTPCGFKAAARFAVKQDTMMRQGHRSALLYRQLKTANKQQHTNWEK